MRAAFNHRPNRSTRDPHSPNDRAEPRHVHARVTPHRARVAPSLLQPSPNLSETTGSSAQVAALELIRAMVENGLCRDTSRLIDRTTRSSASFQPKPCDISHTGTTHRTTFRSSSRSFADRASHDLAQ